MAQPGQCEAGGCFQWLRHGQQALEVILDAIAQARSSVRLETFIFQPDAIGNVFRAALLAAQQRGVRVQVMCDAVGSFRLPTSYWEELVAAGGEVRWFNPLQIHRFAYREFPGEVQILWYKDLARLP